MDTNNITIIGRLVRNAEPINGGITFSVANNGYKKDDCTFFRCTWFGDVASKLAKYITHGRQVCVNGRMACRKKDDKEYWGITVNNLQFVGTSSDKSEGSEKLEDKEDLGGFEEFSKSSEEFTDEMIPF